jgi:light-regulated signal transduction histidine kinase (bacteriophytochrome)
VVGYLQMLSEGSAGALPDPATEFIHRALHAAESMGTLIDDLLNYALAGKAIGTLSATNAAKAVDRALSNLHAEVEESGAKINAGNLPVVRADSSQLTRLFQNLIGNSVKYRCEDRPLEVEIAAQRRAGEWEFSVADNGAGLGPDEAASVFTMFYRGSSALDRPGSGIGLAICKKVVEGHGGRISAEPREDGGTVVRFTLPAANGEVAKAPH